MSDVIVNAHYYLLKNFPEISYLTFSSNNDFTISTLQSTKSWNGTIYYSTNGINWSEWDGTSAISSFNGRLYFRGSNNTYISRPVGVAYCSWVITATSDVECLGNIEYLLDWETVENGNHPTMASSCFNYMFRNCSKLAKAPTLPATTLSEYCYAGMFEGCTALTEAPALPATTLASHCYTSMFQGSGLTSTPSLPAGYHGGYSYQLATYCYQDMFKNCVDLTTTKAVRGLPSYCCCDGMFEGCINLEVLPAIDVPSAGESNPPSSCFRDMFNGCSKIKMSATQAGEYTNRYNYYVSNSSDYFKDMFTDTGGSFTGTPLSDSYLYTSNTVVTTI